MTPRHVAEAYFTAWETGDFETLRSLLADDVTFAGALGTASGAEECVQGLRGMSEILDRIEVQMRLADDTDVMTWFDLHTTVAPPTPTVNWSRVVDGKVTQIRVTFDPRDIIASSAE